MNDVRHSDESDEYFFVEGCHILEISNTDDDEALSIARARVAPGVRTRRHSLRDSVERYVILSGAGRVEIGDAPAVDVAAMDVVTIPAGVSQCITNTGDAELVFLAMCTPRFQVEQYVDLE